MKKNSLNEIRLGLRELEQYITYNSNCNKVISDADSLPSLNLLSLNELIVSSKSFNRKKIFEYNSYIITLYGLFERFIENTVYDYLSELCFILKEFNKLPKKIIAINLDLNIDILRNLSNPKFQNLSQKDILRNLHNAVNENMAVLNFAAFQHHPYNFKQSVVADFFGNLGISNLEGLLKIHEPLKTLLLSLFDNPANINSDILYRIIDDLSQRRNDVAHGVENVEILNVGIIHEYIAFIKSYCESVYCILEDELLKYTYENIQSNMELIDVINHSIVCCSFENINVKKGDFIIIEKPPTNYPRYLKSKIEELQIDHVSHESIIITDKKDVAIRLSDYVKSNYKFKLIVTS